MITLFCCTISTTFSLTTLYLAGVVPGKSFLVNWITWWLGDTTGIYIYTPLIFSWVKSGKLSDTMSKNRFELFMVTLISLSLCYLCFGGWLKKGYPVAYINMPPMIWAAIRFPPQIATTLLVGISAIAVLGTTSGYGPFIQPSLNESLLLVQAFIGVLTATTLILIAVVQEVLHAQKMIEEYNLELRTQVEYYQYTKQKR
jgi:integral membrane sensor domain MASE1